MAGSNPKIAPRKIENISRNPAASNLSTEILTTPRNFRERRYSLAHILIPHSKVVPNT